MGEEHRKRKRYFKVHLLEEELALLDVKASEAGMSKSEFIRNMIVYGAAHERTMFSKKDTATLIYELNRIGNNINQIAWVANANKVVDEGEFEGVKIALMELLSEYDKFVRGKSNGTY